MHQTKSSSSSPAASRLIEVPLDRLHPHPANANRMDERHLANLQTNIAREKNYPPLVVRADPDHPDDYQTLDGENRATVLRRLGHSTARCYYWPCDDATALVLLATLNRLEGEDVPVRRAELLAELTALADPEELAQILPEDAGAIRDTLRLLDLDADALLADLEAANQPATDALRVISFAVTPQDEGEIETVIATLAATLTGRNCRGRALAAVCRAYREEESYG